MYLSRDDFAHVIGHSPLVSIDLVVRDESGRVLVGLRLNRPARGSWFVPGGRIYKDERIDDAFLRISHAELGRAIPREGASLLGVYEHLYDDNALEIPGVSTHYVVIAYQLRVGAESLVLPNGQHERFRWMEVDEIRDDAAVHPNTKAYFVLR
ncbi:GDP-mannose mannosyl hydrolase [Mycobacterium sp. CVI_P3]|uniref:GDP-mannose mannosyl hydrolase n=1 Tax=Mycobacterium pinniadriaticum TaxID=2994102 RepID=A0ABT3SNJ6_9MYCO|nr:GDP-mannose mannosyl hydrolase [Mycobacterium pinniadriaticum]MCX2934610.1 GDP-mannose mannosyl hydrolase [Mycobacterium pinniadriaticum]MCX2941033.1 GDP-mannose mannosyl hydrolase [Mycobacterium pinniadriaticum]